MRGRMMTRMLSLCLTVLITVQMLGGTAFTAYGAEFDSVPAVEQEAEEDALSLETDPEMLSSELSETDPASSEVSEPAPAVEEETVEEVEIEAEDEMMLFGLGEGEDSSSPVSHDLSDHIKTLEIIGNPSSVTAGSKVTVKLGWLIEGEIHGGTDQFTYQLPVNFKISGAVTGGITKGEKGEVIGSYYVDTNGLITITYNSDYNTNGQTTINYMEITGEAVYNSDTEDDEIKFEWTYGNVVLVVTNPGDFTLNKTAEKVYPNETLSNSSIVQYTVTLASELGTQEGFTIEDALAPSENGFDSVALDPNSFAIVDGDGNSVTGWNVDVTDLSFTITNLPKLEAGGTYVLTYNANVERPGTSGTTSESAEYATIDNVVTATSGDQTLEADAQVEYAQILVKTSDGFKSDKGRNWIVIVRTDHSDITGFRVHDVSEHPFSEDVEAQMFDANGVKIGYFAIPDTKGKTEFTYTIPYSTYDGKQIFAWRFTGYTNTEVPAGQTEVATKNTATLSSDPGNDEWTVTRDSVIRGLSVTPTKSWLGEDTTEESAESKEVTLHWTSSIAYTGVSVNRVTFTDRIGQSHMGSVNWDGEYRWDNSEATTKLHYSYANLLDADLKSDSTGLLIEMVDGTTYNYSQAEAAGYTVDIKYYSDMNNTADETEVAAYDMTTKVRSFQVTVTAPVGVNRLEVKNISLGDYRTIFDKTYVKSGDTWKMDNKMDSGYGVADSSAYYSVGVGELSKYVQVVDSKAGESAKETSHWAEGSVDLDYDKQNGKLVYRLVLTVPEGQDSVTVTDLVPKGLTLAGGAGSVPGWEEDLKIGPYTSYNGPMHADNSSYYGGIGSWTNDKRRANISVTQTEEAEGTRLTVVINNLDSELELLDNRMIGIQYTVTLPESLNTVEGSELVKEDNGFSTTATFKNIANYGDVTASQDSTVIQNQRVLDKVGEQMKENGAATSRVHYTVTVNPEALDLIEGSDVLTMTDSMSSDALDFKLDPTSIKLTNAETGEEVDPLSVHINQPEKDGDVCSQSYTIQVKDTTSYILEYDFIAEKREDLDAETSGEFVNAITLEGYFSVTDTTSVDNIAVRVTSNYAGAQLVKVDDVNNTKFLTAVFQLEKYNKNTASFEKLDEVTLEGLNGYTFDYFSKDCVLEGNTLYRLIETQEPKGYVLDETPFYFMIKGNIQDVRNGTVTMVNLTESTQEEAYAASGATVSQEDIHFLNPGDGAYFEIGNSKSSITVAGEKNWNDENDRDGIRPDEITIRLFANNEEIRSKVVTEADGWSWNFEALPETDEQDQDIIYTIKEDAVENYTTSYDGYDVTNSYTPQTTSVSGTKIWNDEEDQDGIRPDSITINLLADGQVVDTQTVTEADDWSWEFDNLPKNRDGGVEIVYSITEDAVENYTTSYDGYDVTNSYTPGQTSVSVSKVWDDEDDKDKIRPEEITVVLLADGEETGNTLVLNEDNHWTGSFGELDMMKAGTEIVYTVAEVHVEGYTSIVTGDQKSGYTITNKHTPEEPEKPKEDTPKGETPKKNTPKDKTPKGKTTAGSTSGRGVKTGDAFSAIFWITVLGAAIIGAIVIVKRRRKES